MFFLVTSRPFPQKAESERWSWLQLLTMDQRPNPHQSNSKSVTMRTWNRRGQGNGSGQTPFEPRGVSKVIPQKLKLERYRSHQSLVEDQPDRSYSSPQSIKSDCQSTISSRPALAALTDSSSRRMRELKKDEFGVYLEQIERQEPEIRGVLAMANGIIDAIFDHPDSCAAPAAESIYPGHNPSQELLPLFQTSTYGFDGAASADTLEAPRSVHTQGNSPLETPDTFSGPDLDVLLTYSY